MPRTNMTLIEGSANFKSSTLSDHVTIDGHKQAMKEKNHEDSISAGSLTHPEKTYIDLLLFINLLELPYQGKKSRRKVTKFFTSD